MDIGKAYYILVFISLKVQILFQKNGESDQLALQII